MTDTDSIDRQRPPPESPGEPPMCPYCDARFVDKELLALHWGQRHPDRLTDEQRAAYTEARESEREDVRLFRLKALTGLLLIYFGFIYVYAFVI